MPPKDGFKEVGTTGIKRYSGYVDEEFLTELQGQRGIRIYKEMWDNSPVVGAMIRAIMLLARGVEFRVDPGGENTEDEEAAELVETSLHDMSQSWDDVLTEILSMLPFGFSFHEIVYKYRRGDLREPGKGSMHSDNKIGWRKIPIRSQDSLWEWDFDEDGGIKAFRQQSPTSMQVVDIPITKGLLFRPEVYKNNPYGRSVLRCAYRPWYFLKKIENIEGIGIERDLAGYPTVRLPGEIIDKGGSALTTWENAIQNIRRDEQEGALIPSDLWPGTDKPMYEFVLTSTGGQRQIDTTPVIDRYNRLIAMTVLADFLFVGQSAVGTHSLVSSRTTLFANALGGWLGSICSVFNRHAIPRLLAVNGIRVDKPPTLEHGDIERRDPEILAKALNLLSAAGFNLAGDEKVENVVRQEMALPELTDEDMEILQEQREERRNQDQRAGQEEMQRQIDELRQQGGGVQDEETD